MVYSCFVQCSTLKLVNCSSKDYRFQVWIYESLCLLIYSLFYVFSKFMNHPPTWILDRNTVVYVWTRLFSSSSSQVVDMLIPSHLVAKTSTRLNRLRHREDMTAGRRCCKRITRQLEYWFESIYNSIDYNGQAKLSEFKQLITDHRLKSTSQPA